MAAEYRMYVNSLSFLSAHRSSSLVGTAESRTKFPWNSLGRQLSFFFRPAMKSYLLDLLYCLVPPWDPLGDATVPDIGFWLWFGESSGERLGDREC